MKIVFCLNNFLPHQVAGTEIYVHALAKKMKERGYVVKILIPNYGKNINEIYIWEDVEVLQFAEPSIVDRALITGKTIPDGVEYFKDIIVEEQPDIVHFHSLSGSNGITLHHLQIVKLLQIKIIITFHLANYTCKTSNLLYKNAIFCNGLIDIKKCTICVYHNKGIGYIGSNILYVLGSTAKLFGYNANNLDSTIGTAIGFPYLVEKLKNDLLLIADLSDRLVVLTKWYKNVLILNGVKSNKITYISQGLPNANFKPNEINISTTFLRLVFIGRIIETKGVHLLLQALSRLQNHTISLDIFGGVNDVGYANKWKQFSSTMVNVKWCGVLSPNNIVNTLRKYDCLCLPSVICEMSPLVIQEAFAAGIPVIASNVYGNAEQIKDGRNGWLFNFNDSNDLKNKLEKLLQNPLLISVAKTKIISVKSFTTVSDEHELMYKELFLKEN